MIIEVSDVPNTSFSTTNKTNHSNLPCGEKMYFPNAASGYEWNRMATLSIRVYSLHPWVHCVLYKFVVFEIFVVEKSIRTFSSTKSNFNCLFFAVIGWMFIIWIND